MFFSLSLFLSLLFRQWICSSLLSCSSLLLLSSHSQSSLSFFLSPSLIPSSPSPQGTCSVVHNFERYEFPLSFSLGPSYPVSPPPLALPSLDGATEKMYRGGAICLDAHFVPLWSRNFPHFGIAHALALGLAPWLAAEISSLVESGAAQKTEQKK